MTYRDHVSTETLADHAEGLLGESEAGRVQAHLDDCEACRSEAMLLVSLQEILRADEVGPMPAEYASRIDVVLADLAAAEPVRVPSGASNSAPVPILNAPAEAESAEAGGAKVIDLATRRKLMVTGLRRVGTVAAGVVLLIGGAALGVQTLGNHTDLVSPGPSQEAIAPARAFEKLPTAPPDAVTRKHGIKVDEKSGWIYMPNGKVLLPDGTVVLPGKHKSDPPTVIAPKPQPQKPAGGNETIVPPKKGGGSKPKPAPQATTQPPAKEPAAPTAPEASAAPAAPQARPAVTKAPNNVSAPSNPDDRKVTAQDAKDTYVSQSGSEYTQDNFANKVMDLLTQASHDSPSGSYTSTSTGGPQTEPNSGPTTAPSTSPSLYPQNVAVRYQQADMPPSAPGRGPAAPEVKYRVQRCARQLGQPALVGDEGIWAGHKATIVVVQAQDNANQVIGYVFYGNCSNSNPATEDTAQWEQRVNKPAPQSSPDSTPVPRVGGTSPETTNSRSESVES
jgi:anti-sigma factor RsiW